MKKLLVLFLVSSFLISCSQDEDNPPLNVYFSFDKEVYFVGEEVKFTNETTGGSGVYSFEWNFGDGTTSTEENPVVVYENNGAFTVTLVVVDSDGANAQTQRIVTIDAAPIPDAGNLELRWSSVLGGQVRSVTPAVDDMGYVYMASNSNKLQKFSPEDGSLVWEFDLWRGADGPSPSGNTHGTPSIDSDGTIYIGTGDASGSVGRVYAINPDGSKKWVVTNDLETGFWNQGNPATPRINYLIPAIGEDHIFVGNGGGTGSVLAINKNTGHRVGYIANEDNSGGPAGGVSAGIILTEDQTVIWSGARNGIFGASASGLKAGGNSTWSWRIYYEGDDRPSSNANASLAIGANGIIYGIASYDGMGGAAYAINSNGIEQWRTPIDNVGNLDQGGAVIGINGEIIVTVKRIAGESTGGVVALDPSNGSILWRFGVPEDVSGSAAIDIDGNVHFGTESGSYYIIRADGSDDPLIVRRDVAALLADAGVAGWEPEAGRIWSSPVIDDNGNIYIGITNTDNPMLSAIVALNDEGITGVGDTPWPMRGQNRKHVNRQQ